ncbi:Receptor y region, transmembrane domain- and RING domain-containing protein 3 [Fulvia fulva]|uniref:Receptor y region, transmembrane domain- and RING domain-containing protein 3 n=1 Tax=Passalora fulva TaxID=5499 RepID=A0A9Q8US29_PASFU|nr:Receptor y region, transmembrane domain- and RING domain-containing protein 3 [Fulvia fulva]KAK4619845.1 Receptor y region, transmembrane domain- and RING domain-containing protein 3 [Fulvia fulva]KAK4621117.1 Receptor y region, transmembrane domain- and RING domain-containing protein 3 [Fulvia fulva]UJO20350.1 Receptor y region, transmembrane domain- and RING domain-containing protein 3 [Fulvia fulva]WPV17186.1 Receptor y region, transmembrane domain- and RING domain-containing protein 3 [F
MDSALRALWTALLVFVAALHMATAQSISPTNATSGTALEQDGLEEAIEIGISQNEHAAPMAIFSVAGLTADSQRYTPESGLSGNIILANASSQLTIAQDNLVLISCDPYSGNIQPQDVFDSAKETNVGAIILFSERATGCQLTGTDSNYRAIYSTISSRNASDLIGVMNSQDADRPAYAQIAPRDALASIARSQNGSSNGQNNHQTNPLGPSPSTAVAMIILYSITGIITALFLVIIITGAVRAHRHPERYGPRTGIGRPRQSRARGLARAMLETIPIVKFGDREGDQPKPADVESAEGAHGSVEMLPVQDGVQQPQDTTADETTRDVAAGSESSNADEGGIAAAAAVQTSPKVSDDDNPCCSICTEEFQRGEDQRVLPCDHRFHPACIDPWLLNVSGTCPLCRIDLRPPASRGSVDETDEHGNPIARDENGERLAPPLADADGNRRSVRRSPLHGLIGSRPERMTREERVAALRRYRDQQAARTDEQTQRTNQALDEETSVRRRLRNAFRIRTRRTGENGQTVETEQQAAPADAATQDNAASSRPS